jgi:catechol 2,3-dioxygenase-like lactoylglutathione lyase family enzyme
MSQAPPRFGWGHVNINVRDLDRAVEFYRKLGFDVFLPAIPYLNLQDGPECRPLPDAAATAFGVKGGTRGRACIMELDAGFPKLDLTELEDVQQTEPRRNSDLGLVRICLASNDLRADVARLAEQGIDFISEPVEAHNGMAEIAVCVDPDGTLIELIQVHLERWSKDGERT